MKDVIRNMYKVNLIFTLDCYTFLLLIVNIITVYIKD